MKKIKNNLFPVIEKEEEFKKIYNNTLDKVNKMNNLYSDKHITINCDELIPMIERMNNFMLNLSVNTSLEEYLSFKLLIQNIERFLGECNHDDSIIPPPLPELEPSIIKAVLKNINKKLVGELEPGENDKLITSVEYELYKNNDRVEKITLISPLDKVFFTSNTPGEYHFVSKYFWKDTFKEILSNRVTIEEETILPPLDDEFPTMLPYSNLWAHTVKNGENYEITLNNTWGEISPKVGVYQDGQLLETITTNYTSLNKGSAKNKVSITNYSMLKDIKFVYKVTYTRDEQTNDKVVVYYKSTTGKIEIAVEDGGVKYCEHPEWNSEIEYGTATGKIVYYSGFHFKHSGWASKGDTPKLNGDWSPWTKLTAGEELQIDCPGQHVMDAIGKIPNAHLEPMNIAEVEGIGSPMEKKHITYSAEWGKWGGRKYTPKVSPWNKISHMQYAFIDVTPDYSGEFITDKDDISHLGKAAQDVATGAGALNVSPNIFDPGAAFSKYGGTNAYMTEFMEMGKKYPYVKPIASLGGWSRSGFFRDAASDEKRDYFVKRCVDFIREFNFVGIDIDWEFPCSRRDGDLVDNKNDLGTPRAKDDEDVLFNKLMQSLRIALDNAGKEDGKYYFLSCAIVSGKNHIEKSGIALWHKTCDFISYMTYDIHGAFDSITNHQSYLFQNQNEPSIETNPQGNAMSIKTLIDYVTKTYGVSAKKITVGTPFYSRGWSGVFKPVNGWPTSMPGLYVKTNINAASNGAKGCSAPGTMDGGRGAGVLPLVHLNKLMNGENVSVRTIDLNGPANPHAGTILRGADFKYYYDEQAQTPYLYNEKDGIFYTFEDEQSLDKKCQWVLENNLAGIISWDIGMDDYGVDMHGAEATSAYPNLYQADHLLTSVIFNRFKTDSLRLNYLNRVSRG
ncbi:glycosyl hydrolase family 18 protein [uncultured Cetobacterium sp.]|uniref:glycoside hydrolase family 18 protein n=1 Tax=uncultured Cetobacterium sp. TaxID=527638 RepID=UPI002620E647|nr:glycosyl hydrolase family 18 protein [uncultured Cetobacterium sp.]